MPFTIIRQDITQMRVDAIVNAANTELRMGGGVCGTIFQAAGAHDLQAVCDQLSPIQTGQAVLTPGFALKAKYVIHAVGPVYQKSNAEQSEVLLRSAYMEALRIAAEAGCESVAFPLISSGIYGYPKAEALRVATNAIQDFLKDHDLDVYLAVFGASAFAASKALLGAVESYIDDHYVKEHIGHRRQLLNVERAALREVDDALSNLSAPMAGAPTPNIDKLVGSLDEPFSSTLLRLIDAKGKTDAEVYKRANIDRKLFSKIRTAKGYMPGKRTILALSVALELTLAETEDLLKRAGYALSHSRKFDVIVEYFLLNGRYDIYEINEVLFQYDQPLLGG